MDSLIARDLKHVWHPCTRMQDLDTFPPVIVTGAQGSYIQTSQGTLIDGISSWWCKSLGHGHPAILAAIRAQLRSFEHIMPANTTHSRIVALAEELAAISHKQHVYFASDGACAVEIAIKLAIQAKALQGQPERHQLIALRNGYHGDTIGALSVSDVGRFKEAWASFGVPCNFLSTIPYVCTTRDPLWHNADAVWPHTLAELDRLKDKACAIILEPIVQGSHGFWPYSADFLAKLTAYAKAHNVYLIADEIMTGLGRTGEWLASQHAKIAPDMICLSKGLTSGTVPMSCVLIDHAIFELFYQQQDPQHSFLHSHTFGGNPLGVAAALATIQTMRTEGIHEQARVLGTYMHEAFQYALSKTGQFANIRGIGAMVAADFTGGRPGFGQAFAAAAEAHGALLRPLGNTLYWFPPLNTAFATIDALADITQKALHEVIQDTRSCTA